MYMLYAVIYSIFLIYMSRVMLHAMILFLNLSLFYICLSKYRPYKAYVVLLYNIQQKIKFLCLCLYWDKP